MDTDIRARIADLNRRIQSSEAYLVHAAGTDRRIEQRHLAKLKRERDALRARLQKAAA